MRLSALEDLHSFALIGPGFAGGWRLVAPLTEGAGPLLFARYEDTAPRAFGGPVQAIDLDLDVPPATLEPVVDLAGYVERVATIREAIARGDVYEVNLTVRARFRALAAAAFARIAGPRFSAWLRLPDGSEVLSASPELLFEVEGDRVRSEPMKGTAPAGGLDELRASAKDTAELAMITDLVRHELTSICEPRSVRVLSERRFIELPYAVQAVSDVVGRLTPGLTPTDIFAAMHPGGSVTGAPKKAAMELISALEPSLRDAYCGTLAFTEGGRTRASLLIRTASGRDGEWTYGTGGAIVWQSEAEAERAEILVKLGALG